MQHLLHYTKKAGTVACVFFGDGATNEGVFHECLNLASAWKLPVLFLIENNGFAITTPIQQVSVPRELYRRAEAYEIDCRQVDGQNVEEVFQAAESAVSHMKEGKGPVLIEAKTFLFRGHQAGSYYEKLANSGYRDPKVVEDWIENRDPIQLYAVVLQSRGSITKERVIEIYEEESKLVEEAVKYAEGSALPAPDDACRNVYV